MENDKQSSAYKGITPVGRLVMPPNASQANQMVAYGVPCLVIPAVMIGLFYANIKIWIGDKTCFVNQIDGVA